MSEKRVIKRYSKNKTFKKRTKRFINLLKGLFSVLRRRPLILVYQMGKVGSQSVEQAIQKKFPSYEMLFFHLQRLLWKHFKDKYILLRASQITKRPMMIVCPIRESVDRNISSFSHDFPSYCYLEGIFDEVKTMHEVGLDQLKDIFFNQYNRHDFADKWFIEEFLKHTGINVYDKPFDKTKGYQTYEHENIKLLVFKSELPDQEKAKCISAFLGVEIQFSERVNTYKERTYKANYTELKELVLSNQDYLSKVHQGIFYQHFYS